MGEGESEGTDYEAIYEEMVNAIYNAMGPGCRVARAEGPLLGVVAMGGLCVLRGVRARLRAVIGDSCCACGSEAMSMAEKTRAFS